MPSITAAKEVYEERLNSLLETYSTVMFCLMDNVRSQQIHDVRRDLRGKAVLLMGKKTLQAKIIDKRSKEDSSSDMDKEFNEKCDEFSLLKGNTALLFTNEETSTITSILDAHRVQAPARVGAIAPCDVVIPAGNTGMEPTTTSFFQALNIATKIAKGTVEIISDKKVLSAGDRVDNSTAALLQKLKISPFYYQLEVLSIWDNGVVFSKEDLSITNDFLESTMVEAISNLNGLSMGADIPTEASLPSMLMNAFKDLLGVSIATDYIFEEFNGRELREAALEGKLGGGTAAASAAAPSGSQAQSAAAVAPQEEEEDEEDDFGMGGLF